MGMRGSCRLCGSERFKTRFEKNGFRLDRCLQCTLTQVTNPPGSYKIESYYDEGFFDKYYDKLQRDPKRQAYEYKKFNYRLEEIEKWAQHKGNILDIGCSFGFFLNAAQRRGWQAFGLEIAAVAAQYARAKFGLTVVNKPVEDIDFESEFFDVVTMWNVIEHLEDPVGAARQISRILKPGGMFVLTTGNIESPLARFQKGKWRMLIPPIHLSHFSPSTITHLLQLCGLEVIEQTSALPYESLMQKLKIIALIKNLNVSDKMLIYARKSTTNRAL